MKAPTKRLMRLSRAGVSRMKPARAKPSGKKTVVPPLSVWNVVASRPSSNRLDLPITGADLGAISGSVSPVAQRSPRRQHFVREPSLPAAPAACRVVRPVSRGERHMSCVVAPLTSQGSRDERRVSGGIASARSRRGKATAIRPRGRRPRVGPTPGQDPHELRRVAAPTLDRAFARWRLTVECARPRRWAAAFSIRSSSTAADDAELAVRGATHRRSSGPAPDVTPAAAPRPVGVRARHVSPRRAPLSRPRSGPRCCDVRRRRPRLNPGLCSPP